MPRLPIAKTPKVYVGGAFIRSESGRTFPLRDARGRLIGHVPQCTRKDLRNAVEAAAKAGPGWARRTAYNRGQILYRLAEMIEARTAELSRALAPATNRAAAREVAASVDRLIHYAGWADKCEQALGSVNAVAGPFFNFTTSEPMGVIGVIAPAECPLLALVSLIAPAIVSGNTVVALASEPRPYAAIVLGEMLATSDLPGGVVNLLTGLRRELLPTFASHAHLRALSGVANGEERTALERGSADSIRRVRLLAAEEPRDWFADSAQGLPMIRELVEFKTTWHPVGA
ncbi:MAG: aldehyde dehydrogenase [Verrucomicrobia bacterium]|nr:aldehyde dehydrogenase [Verrucomicrobiota bacterium]